MNALRSLKGAKALVTGAGSGMGRATAELFAQEGAMVAVTDHVLAPAEAVAATLRDAGLDARAWKMDVSDGEEIARVWGLYMAGSRLAFERNEIQLHHVLATRTDANGASGYPLRHAF